MKDRWMVLVPDGNPANGCTVHWYSDERNARNYARECIMENNQKEVFVGQVRTTFTRSYETDEPKAHT